MEEPMLRVQQLSLTLEEDIDLLFDKLVQKLHIDKDEIISWHIVKESIDARKGDIHFSYAIDCEVKNEENILKRHKKDVTAVQRMEYQLPKKGVVGLTHRPIVVGFGPAGMFASLLLAQMGYQPLIIERGEAVDERVKRVEEFWEQGILDSNCNVQFGEGGAGTFSDGKLTTRVKDTRIHKILEELVRFGAPAEILYQAHPHIGTDLLREIVKRLRNEIVSLGGEIRFQSTLTDLHIEKGVLQGIDVNHQFLPCEQLILAIGHSARDTLRMLMDRGVSIHSKAFAIGARLEHPQAMIDKAQYKQYANHPRLKAAEYRLTHTASNGRGVYTFCMCPGGYVVPSSSMLEGVVVNGMSLHARDGENANSALLVQIRPEDYGDDPEKAIAFQEQIEHAAFLAAGSNYQAPAQRVVDFLHYQKSKTMGSVKPSYVLGVVPSNLHDILPTYVCEAMVEGIVALDRKLKGFAMDDAVLTGVETRSSSPVRLERNKENCSSINVDGLYPCGEGAGYAGGIVSAAIDGLRCAEKLISIYRYEQ